jgi:hypothetical protein
MKTIYILLAVSVVLPTIGAEHAPSEASRIPAQSIGKEFVIVGGLGLPLGTKVEIYGEVIRRHPSIGLEVTVKKIGNLKADNGLVLKLESADGSDLSKYLGKNLILTGEETGRLTKIDIVNQVDRKCIGNVQCEVTFVASKVELSDK